MHARRDDEIEHLQTPAGLAPVGAGVLADAAVHSLPILGPLLSLVSACGPAGTAAVDCRKSGFSGGPSPCSQCGETTACSPGHGMRA